MEFEDTNWTFIAYCNEINQLNALFFSFSWPWKKKFEVGLRDFYPRTDAARYIRLFLKLFKEYEIKGITSYIWWC